MIGRTIAHYKIIEKLGEGGSGAVYRAEDTKLGRTVALKVLSTGRGLTDSDRARFEREARSAGALRHPNICTVYEIGEFEGVWYISMTYIPGKNLRQMVQDGPLEMERALNIAVQIADGLKAAHETGVVHRDIKSANIMVDEDDRVTILDFGLAKPKGGARITDHGTMMGTAAYMSPEQARGKTVDHRTDIWSLGVCLYEMITGRLPFPADETAAVVYQLTNEDPPAPSSIRPKLPAVFDRMIQKALEKDPADRYPSADELLADLEAARADIAAGLSGPASALPSVAVLPFVNMSPEKEQDFLCDGIAEEIIHDLTRVQGIRVAARSSSFAFRGSAVDIRQIGRRLGVNNVLEGSIRKSGNKLRVTAQLISVSDGYHLWSERYDRDLKDVFAVQDEISANIVQAMAVRLTEKEKKALRKVPTVNVEAYGFYARGRQYFHRLGAQNLDHARNMFTSAIIRDPRYAMAYCGLADCCSMIYMYYDSDKTNIENALTASERALEIDAELAEAHASRGLAVSLDGRFAEAETEFNRAIELSPRLFEAHYFYARTARAQGHLEKAAELFAKSGEVRPEDYQSPILCGDCYRGLNRVEDKIAAFRRGLAVAERHLELQPEDARAWYLGAHAQLEIGRRDKALEWNERAMKLGPDDPATLYNAGCLFSVMGEYEKCFESLEKALDNGFAHRVWLESDPDLEPIRSDPRYQALLDRM
jgi:serine/threonine protein kinase/Flp pilus assembly protein TadD